jgi:uncharacterized membrane protein
MTKTKKNNLKKYKMKKINMYYWIVTGLFAAFMAFTAIPDITMAEDAVKMITNMGYPPYFIPFIGVAKVLGSIAILVPGFKRVKEWAYAGLFFDLVAAIYSIIHTEGVQPQLLFLFLPLGMLFFSYYLWHRKSKMVEKTV